MTWRASRRVFDAGLALVEDLVLRREVSGGDWTVEAEGAFDATCRESSMGRRFGEVPVSDAFVCKPDLEDDFLPDLSLVLVEACVFPETCWGDPATLIEGFGAAAISGSDFAGAPDRIEVSDGFDGWFFPVVNLLERIVAAAPDSGDSGRTACRVSRSAVGVVLRRA